MKSQLLLHFLAVQFFSEISTHCSGYTQHSKKHHGLHFQPPTHAKIRRDAPASQCNYARGNFNKKLDAEHSLWQRATTAPKPRRTGTAHSVSNSYLAQNARTNSVLKRSLHSKQLPHCPMRAKQSVPGLPFDCLCAFTIRPPLAEPPLDYATS